MRRPSRLLILPPLLLFAACGEDQLPTTPTSRTANSVTSAAASRLVVNSLADPGDGICNARECTLREAIEDARSSAIGFAPGLTGAITLARPGAGGGTLVIDKQLSIVGPGSGLTIRRRSTDPAFRLLTVGTHATVTLTNLNLRNGKADRPGAGIINFGTLTLTNCSVTGNSTTQHGGGIDNHGPLTLRRSAVQHNSAPGFSAAGIDNHRMTVILTNSSVSDNSGVGIFNGGGRLEVTNSSITNNLRRGIDQDWGRATLNHVRIEGNKSGGISNHQGGVFLTNSTVALNSSSQGGGISNSAGGFVSVVKSTISNNSASDLGGGIRNTSGDPFGRLSASVELINSTVSGNSARIGGGIENSNDLGGAEVTIINSTIARNSARTDGGGVRNEDSEEDSDQSNSVFLINSIVARNTAPLAPDVADGAGRFNLIGIGTGSGISNSHGNQVGTSSSPINPRIGPLVNNGGPTRTHALLAGSPAIDAASAADCPATDQRGVPRPQRAGCDIGSYELR